MGLDNCVNEKNIKYFEKAYEIDLANFKNQILEDFKDGNHVSKSQKKHETLFWAYVPENLNDSGRRKLVVLLVSEDSRQSRFQPSYISQKISVQVQPQSVLPPAAQSGTTGGKKNDIFQHQYPHPLQDQPNATRDKELDILRDLNFNPPNFDPPPSQSQSHVDRNNLQPTKGLTPSQKGITNQSQKPEKSDTSTPSPDYYILTNVQKEKKQNKNFSRTNFSSFHLSHTPKNNPELSKNVEEESYSKLPPLPKPGLPINPFRAQPTLAGTFLETINQNQYHTSPAKLFKSWTVHAPSPILGKLQTPNLPSLNPMKTNFSVLRKLHKSSVYPNKKLFAPSKSNPTISSKPELKPLGGLDLLKKMTISFRASKTATPINVDKPFCASNTNLSDSSTSVGLNLFKSS